MFDPDGWMPVPYIVTWLAGLGREGKLPRHLGFVHPGDVASPLDLSAEATARHVLGGKLAAGILSSVAIFDPSGLRLPVPAYYWSSRAAAATMETGTFDSNVIGLQNDFLAEVFLNIDEVTAALDFRLISPEVRTPSPPAREGKHAPPADLPRYGELTMCPVERREPPPLVRAAEEVSLPESEPEASLDLPEPAIADGVVKAAESSNDVAAPPRMPSDADLDSCIKASAAGSKDRKTSGRQLRTDAPPWFAKNHIRPVTQADMERRLSEKNAALRRGTGKRRGSGEVP